MKSAMTMACMLFIFANTGMANSDEFLREFRCVTCPNQNIVDSPSPIAKAMKEDIIRRLDQGESEESIRNHLLSHYGDYVVYRPVIKKQNGVLWLAPFAMLILGIVFWGRFLKKAKSQS